MQTLYQIFVGKRELSQKTKLSFYQSTFQLSPMAMSTEYSDQNEFLLLGCSVRASRGSMDRSQLRQFRVDPELAGMIIFPVWPERLGNLQEEESIAGEKGHL